MNAFDTSTSPDTGNTIPGLLQEKPSAAEVRQAQQAMIMSASGWRKVFAGSGNEEDASGDIRPADIVLTGIIALGLSDFLTAHLKKDPAGICLVVACDSRPTGSIIANAFMRVISFVGMQIRYLSIAAAPEVMSYSACCGEVDAFAYISASHNPIGHNGFKFGLNTGGVLPAHLVRELEGIFFEDLAKKQDFVYSALINIQPEKMQALFQSSGAYKQEALRHYRHFSETVIVGSEAQKTETLAEIRSALQNRPTGILGELNGSARCLSIDRDFLEGLGAQVMLLNDRPGQIVHRIIPEGESLNLCRTELEKLHRNDPTWLLGYVPDNDGDRGNIVCIERDGRAHILEAQAVFALVALAEAAWMAYRNTHNEPDNVQRAAIVANGPTSMRINELAERFGMDCFRAEVGEANAVTLAEKLRSEGRIIRITGEGSNGGSIIHPASVRDPLNSIGSILKLLTIRDSPGKLGLFHICCQRFNRDYSPDFTMDDVLSIFPTYTTTNSYEDIAIMHIRSQNHKKLKAAWEEIFLQDWAEQRRELAERWSLERWVEVNTEGSEEKIGFGPEYRSGDERGGLKILFSDSADIPQAYIWMRGSGTEPLFRVLADVRGDRPELEAYLLRWQRSMIERADAKVHA